MKNQGFTLIELMITVVIVGILAAIGIPAYNGYIVRSNRALAQAQMLDIASRQAQFLVANRSYATKAQLEATGFALPDPLGTKYTYDIVVGTGAMPSYTITFTATGSQTSDGNLSLDSAGTKTPASKW